jgi:hypothetical protein
MNIRILLVLLVFPFLNGCGFSNSDEQAKKYKDEELQKRMQDSLARTRIFSMRPSRINGKDCYIRQFFAGDKKMYSARIMNSERNETIEVQFQYYKVKIDSMYTSPQMTNLFEIRNDQDWNDILMDDHVTILLNTDIIDVCDEKE